MVFFFFRGKKGGKGRNGGCRNLCTICGMILQLFLTKSYGPPFFIGSIVKIRGGETCTPGKLPHGLPFPSSRSTVGLQGVRAEWGIKTGKFVHNIISLFPCKAGIVSCSYSSIYIDWLIALLSHTPRILRPDSCWKKRPCFPELVKSLGLNKTFFFLRKRLECCCLTPNTPSLRVHAHQFKFAIETSLASSGPLKNVLHQKKRSLDDNKCRHAPIWFGCLCPRFLKRERVPLPYP